MKQAVLVLAISLSCSLVSLAQESQLKRVDKFPQGSQTSWAGSALTGIKDVNTVRHKFDAPYDKVWAAAKRVSQTLDKMGGRPLVAIDEQSGRLQNGKVELNALVGLGDTAWKDEFVIEATRLTKDATLVSVTRKVVQKNSVDHQWKTYLSNSNLELWFLTQIEDEIKNEGVDYAQSAPGKYVREKKPNDYLELKADGTFSLRQGGKTFDGKYEVAGNVLTMVMKGRAARAKMQGDAIIDPDDGKRWIKEGGSGETPAPPTPTPAPGSPRVTDANQPSEVLTNADVIRLVEAKLAESAIIAKIRNSACKFDTTVDALVKLKQAGVSDAVIQAMAEKSPK